MWLTLRATVLICLFSICGRAHTRALAVYTGPVEGLAAESRTAMQAEVQRLLSSAGLEIIWRSIADRKSGEDFDAVTVASFDGSCSALQTGAAPGTVSLADTSVVDGRILPFFRVDCTRVLQLLGPYVQPAVLGRALGRVIAHEIYHIVARTTDHHDTGVAKAAFSLRDLTKTRFEFDAWSVARMQPANVATGSGEDVSSATGR